MLQEGERKEGQKYCIGLMIVVSCQAAKDTVYAAATTTEALKLSSHLSFPFLAVPFRFPQFGHAPWMPSLREIDKLSQFIDTLIDEKDAKSARVSHCISFAVCIKATTFCGWWAMLIRVREQRSRGLCLCLWRNRAISKNDRYTLYDLRFVWHWIEETRDLLQMSVKWEMQMWECFPPRIRVKNRDLKANRPYIIK